MPADQPAAPLPAAQGLLRSAEPGLQRLQPAVAVRVPGTAGAGEPAQSGGHAQEEAAEGDGPADGPTRLGLSAAGADSDSAGHAGPPAGVAVPRLPVLPGGGGDAQSVRQPAVQPAQHAAPGAAVRRQTTLCRTAQLPAGGRRARGRLPHGDAAAPPQLPRQTRR